MKIVYDGCLAKIKGRYSVPGPRGTVITVGEKDFLIAYYSRDIETGVEKIPTDSIVLVVNAKDGVILWNGQRFYVTPQSLEAIS